MRSGKNSDCSESASPLLLAVTGASGSIYALKFLEIMDELGVDVHMVFSRAGKEVSVFELGKKGFSRMMELAGTVYSEDDLWAPPSSGSSQWRAMVVLPCTMGTLSHVATGASRNLIQRACDCFLKEGRRLILAVRESPLNRIHLENMLKASEAGAVIFPCMPSFYHRPNDLDDLARFFAGRIAEFLGLRVPGQKRWKGVEGAS